MHVISRRVWTASGWKGVRKPPARVRHLADRLTTGRPSRASRGILRGMLWASVFWAVIIGGVVAWGIWHG